jgi:hypothetical protein
MFAIKFKLLLSMSLDVIIEQFIVFSCIGRVMNEKEFLKIFDQKCNKRK